MVPVQCADSDEVCVLSYSLLHGSFGEDKHFGSIYALAAPSQVELEKLVS